MGVFSLLKPAEMPVNSPGSSFHSWNFSSSEAMKTPTMETEQGGSFFLYWNCLLHLIKLNENVPVSQARSRKRYLIISFFHISTLALTSNPWGREEGVNPVEEKRVENRS